MRNPNTEPNADAAAKSEERPAVKKPLKGKVVAARKREKPRPDVFETNRREISPPTLHFCVVI